MNRTLALVSALGAGLMTTAGISQTPAAPAPAAPAAPAAVEPQAIPAKIALVAFEQAVFATNEGQRAVQGIQDKYKPKKDQIDVLSKEVDSLKAQLQSAPATLSDEERASRLRNIDVKEKELNRDAEDAQTAYNADLQEAYGKVATKVSVTLKDYVSKNGYTLLLDVSGQQSNVMWAVPSTDVTQAVVTAYNASSGVAAPIPSGPSAAPTTARPRPTTTPKPAAPKQ
ncbi:OmpH family outer membrane protein [Tunturiibacter lichenicola]|jgi:Skp family chaperone for outer membrane proteins|uniref:OmpH family outer membrane protein n=1 Tax=Tunturiibacter lichenicola TaxID=2051959 RepID=UPI0021B248A4|nr:OmpH family outer membrane protein [Edaphobacter lichenicola]